MSPKKRDPNTKSDWLVYYKHPEFHQPNTFEADGEYVKLTLTDYQADSLRSWISFVADNLGRHEDMGIKPWKPCPEVLNGSLPCPNEFGEGHVGPHMVWMN